MVLIFLAVLPIVTVSFILTHFCLQPTSNAREWQAQFQMVAEDLEIGGLGAKCLMKPDHTAVNTSEL